MQRNSRVTKEKKTIDKIFKNTKEMKSPDMMLCDKESPKTPVNLLSFRHLQLNT